ncbi:MAG: excinuclease ABC subunit UvrC [Smithellaceae bacterium]|jgi:excinuclease ABC subunit C|nr:excinuclease ABC subunit UvrC [Smithellaceae bacterium]MDD3258166.1 excinuclease ABC subunit UvrC [Smithellaceae bacterium]MDD3849673.1 excinuclease ABC subunit UvrC [Smithellaceae bacterium]HOG12081.1 excinuclease ABC subunit UvrC [Smithellaceae bacterium]HOQ71986.1 excinuclease ABC subunit UvrC [Smithellaceae bacterium]
MDENAAVKEKMASAPRAPGIYIMLDARRKVIYVGKANDLKSRVGSYLTGRDTRPMAPFLMARVQSIEFITTDTEKEALILENNLIKKHRPRYNVILRDDKTYCHLSLNPSEAFPRLRLVRKRQNDAALYFGPYPSGLAARETLRFIQRIFPLRTCRDRDFQLRARPCLEFQIGRCLAPCKNRIDEAAYRTLVENAVSFLRGRRRELISDLKKQMSEAAQSLRYEDAARLRDRIGALEHALERQHVDAGGAADQDVLGVHSDSGTHRVCILFVREGKLLGSKSFTPVKTKADREEILSSALRQYYDEAGLPEEILLPFSLSDEAVLLEWLAEKRQRSVRITVPQRGAKKALVDMACANARELQASDRKKDEQKTAVLQFLRERLSLAGLPRRIECFDISNLGGKNAVGSMVVFQDGEPDKSAYRRFRVRGPDEPDDYGMMREVLTRRFQGRDPVPDLLVVDGGKGQLNVALAVLSDLKIKLDVIGLAKEERSFLAAKRRLQGKPAKSEDRVYLPRRKDAIYLSSSPAALSLLQRLRDEAHRFAVSYHRKLKQKNDFRSALDDIPRLGSRRKSILLRHFGSLERIRSCSPEELQALPGIGRALAETIHKVLSSGGAA